MGLFKRFALAAGLAVILLLSSCTGGADALLRSEVFFGFSENELKSARYTQPDAPGGQEAALSVDGFLPLMQSGQLEVFYNEATAGIRVRDRRSGYVFGGLPSDKPEDMNKAWSAIGNSLITAEYYTSDGALKTLGASGRELTYTLSGKTLSADVRWRDIGISLSFQLKLWDDALTFSLDDSSIREESEERLAAVYFVPFLGSVRGADRQGYIFVPDGPGALIRFGTPKQYLAGYEKRVYGPDFGIDRQNTPAGLQSNRIRQFAGAEGEVTMPVFGIAHSAGESAFLGHVTGGADYAQIAAYPAGLITDYNRAFVRFLYRQKYEHPVSKSGGGVQAVQSERNEINPEITYKFLAGDDAGYVGMAKAYRSFLHESGALEKRSPSVREIPLRLNYLMADVQKEFIGTSVKTITELPAVEESVKALQGDGIKNLQITLEGWRKGGAAGYKVSDPAGRTVFGSLRHLSELRTLLGGQGALMLALSPLTAREGQFSVQRDPAITYSQKASLIPSPDKFLGDLYFMKTEPALKRFEELVQTLRKAEIEPVFSDAGLLYGEYMRGHTVTRWQNRERITGALKAASKEGKLAAVNPNAYLYGVTNRLLQSPMVSSQYLFETDTVPFLQIVLSGSMELFAPYINLSFYSHGDILRQIDYNTYPAYFLTEQGNHALQKTASAHYQSSRLADWSEHIRETYARINPVLREVYGQFINGRTVLERGLVRTDYETGAVYVNYTASEKNLDGITVAPQSALYSPF